jgi:hypothetical protein
VHSITTFPRKYTDMPDSTPHAGLRLHESFRGRIAAGIAAGLILGAAAVSAETLITPPAADNTLYERDAGDLSNGIGPALFIGRTGNNAGNRLRRALLRFDLSAIPPGSEVSAARLVFNVDMVPPSATGFDATLHRVTAAWGEGDSFAPGAGGGGAPAQTGDATWLHRFFDTGFWATPGGDFEPVASATTALGSATGEFAFETGPALVADVQQWVNQPADNFGWILIGEEDNPENARRIASRENPTLGLALEVEFTPAAALPEATPVPTLDRAGLALLAALLAGLALFLLRRRQRD